jgi:hypothetical protein
MTGERTQRTTGYFRDGALTRSALIRQLRTERFLRRINSVRKSESSRLVRTVPR